MKRVILIRHCKSSWDSDGPDHDRPLNGRGRRSAEALGEWLELKGLAPDLWLVSTALRTQETAAGIRDGLGTKGDKRDVRELYMAMPQRIVEIAAGAGGDLTAIVSHNPGIGMAADMLAAAPPEHARFCDYPTGATTVLEFEDQVTAGAGQVVHFVIPRELTE